MNNELIQSEFRIELDRILNYWQELAVDEINGGFYGYIGSDNKPDLDADKGIILNTRILWTFSAAFRFLKKGIYRELSARAYSYLVNYFIDHKFGGVYWMLDCKGNPLNKKKQVYAQAFAIYALSEYYQIEKDSGVMEKAIGIFDLIEIKSYDAERSGYIEAFGEQWNDIEDLRLGTTDQNEKKTMNTHLHILEAYTNLLRIWKNEVLKEKLKELIEIFIRYFIDNKTFHLNLFFNEQWKLQSSKISFGHDIEASWLLNEAAVVLGEQDLITRIRELSLKIAVSACRGIDDDGGLMNELSQTDGIFDTDKHWWPQAECMTGLLNAFELSGESHFYKKFLHTWSFIKKFIIDHKNGEWFWRVNRNGIPFDEEKAGFWKGPYHNVRACIEVINRIGRI